MARNTMEAWIPEEDGSDVIQRVSQNSAVERLARRIPMSTDTMNTPRSAGVGVEVVPKGGAYGEDTSVNDSVILQARKLGKAIRIAEEDLADSNVNVIAAKQRDWATSYAVFLDNACLGVTADENGTTVPFTSVYNAVSSDASANLIQTGGATTYDDLSGVLSAVEGGDYWGADNTIVIAHPAFMGALRGIKDTQGAPIFVQGLAGTPDTLFGLQVGWSRGAKTSAVATDSPAGNPILVAGSKDLLLLGVRSGPESMLSREVGFLTDEPILKMRSRRAFAVGQAEGFGVIEVTAG